MSNPWKDISLSDYEKHMSLDSVKQLQSMNRTMKKQFDDYDVSTVMILGIAGGNGLEHIHKEKYQAVYGVDINETYLQAVIDRYKNLNGILKCINIDITKEADKLPETELLIANLLIEYIGYDGFLNAVMKVKPQYVSCVIQINETEKQWQSVLSDLRNMSGSFLLDMDLPLPDWVCIVYIMFGGARRLEIRQNKNYGNDPQYQEYVKKTPILLPFVPLYSVEKYKWLVG